MLGVCYYPEHWPESMWKKDAEEMRELGLTYVRLAEFAWSKMEPEEGVYDFEWLDSAIQILAEKGLKVILCTPTATPPKWLIDKFPDILPVDINTGVTRGFGSRRHYDFSSKNYHRESMRISEVMATRYANNPAVVGWQTDNELACHDTTHSGSENAKHAFHLWLEKYYGDIDSLNKAWGTIFWSMEYQRFDQIELPILAVTETHPSHQLAYRRFSSEQVINYHNDMIDVLRKHCSKHFMTHNFIPMTDTQADNFALAEKLDFACYDNYPLGRTDLFFADSDTDTFKRYMRTGHPDFSSCSFDQIRGISNDNFWIMEQQPGPVNWAHHNPRPLPGMVRLWSWEAVAHGAETICYFRWRQAAFGQEQMHAGIKRVDNSKSPAWFETEQFRDELAETGFDLKAKVHTSVAIIMSIENQWVTEIERQGDSFSHQLVEFEYYSALRQLGIDVDFVSSNDNLADYKMIVVPCMPVVSDELIDKLADSQAHVIFGPRSGAKTDELTFAPNLGPGNIQRLIPIQVESTETLRADCTMKMLYKGASYLGSRWNEALSIGDKVNTVAQFHNKQAAVVQNDKVTYVATLCEIEFLRVLLNDIALACDIKTYQLPEDIRLSQRGNFGVFFNYSGQAKRVEFDRDVEFVLGSEEIAPYSLSIFKRN